MHWSLHWKAAWNCLEEFFCVSYVGYFFWLFLNGSNRCAGSISTWRLCPTISPRDFLRFGAVRRNPAPTLCRVQTSGQGANQFLTGTWLLKFKNFNYFFSLIRKEMQDPVFGKTPQTKFLLSDAILWSPCVNKCFDHSVNKILLTEWLKHLLTKVTKQGAFGL